MARRALIVEDDRAVGQTLGQILKHMGIASTLIEEGRPVVDWVLENKPDLILLDLMLPDISGYEICQKLKLDRRTNLIPIIIVSARSQHEDVLLGLRVGANHYITKPFSIEELEQAIRSVADWKQFVQRTGTEGEIHFQINSDFQYLHELNQMLASLLLYSGFNQEEALELKTAVWEMGTNAIEWGNRNRVEMPVTVTYRIDKEKVEIIIRDGGQGFDRTRMQHASNPSQPEAHMEVRESMGLRVGGFGILMARGLVDDLQYNDAGNEVRLVKRFARSADGGSDPA